MLSDTQTQKIKDAVSALYNDPEFALVSEFKISVFQTPPPPIEVVDEVDVPKA